MAHDMGYVGTFEKRDHLALVVNFKLVILYKIRVNELSVLGCTVTATASSHKVHCTQVRNYAQWDIRKTEKFSTLLQLSLCDCLAHNY